MSRIVRTAPRIVFYVVLGALLGAVSVSVWPHPLIAQRPNPLISLLLVPLSVGFATVLLSRMFERRSEWETQLSRFLYSCLLAFVFAWVRYSLL